VTRTQAGVASHLAPSKEPGQARHASIGSFPAASAFELGRNVEVKTDSQKSSLFPWDNAGLSSSAAGAPFDIGSDRISIGHDDLRLKDASTGRNSGRESPLVPSQTGTFGFSPGTLGKTGSQINDSFQFDGWYAIARNTHLAHPRVKFQQRVLCGGTPPE
jgi:meiotic recombination protein REC8